MTEDDFANIFQYLKGNATEEERALLEKRLAEDSQFKQDFEETRQGLLLVDFAGLQELKKRTDSLKNDGLGPDIGSGNPRKILLYAVVGLILVFAIFGTWRYLLHSTLHGLFKEYFAVYPAPSGQRPAQSPGLMPWTKGIAAYNEKDYEVATSYLGEVMSASQGSDVEAEFYMAVSRLASDKSIDLAISQLEELSGGNHAYQQKAQWYLGLAYLKQKNEAKATEMLQKVQSTPNHPFQSEAKSLLNEI